MRSGAPRRAVFLDRDGTLNEERDFLADPDQLVVLPGAAAALRALHDRGFALVVVTNQSGIARGMYDEATLTRIHERLHPALDRLPIAYLHCPHHPEQDGPYGRACECRKPGTGMIRTAQELFDLELDGSFVVGDSARDVIAGATLPLRSVLVRSGKPWQAQLDSLTADGYEPDHVADGIADATRWILAQD